MALSSGFRGGNGRDPPPSADPDAGNERRARRWVRGVVGARQAGDSERDRPRARAGRHGWPDPSLSGPGRADPAAARDPQRRRGQHDPQGRVPADGPDRFRAAEDRARPRPATRRADPGRDGPRRHGPRRDRPGRGSTRRVADLARAGRDAPGPRSHAPPARDPAGRARGPPRCGGGSRDRARGRGLHRGRGQVDPLPATTGRSGPADADRVAPGTCAARLGEPGLMAGPAGSIGTPRPR